MKTSITASMLYDLVQCPHRVTMDLFEDFAKRDPVNPFVQLLWEKGNAFEKEVIEGLQVPFVNLRPFSEKEREQLTREAMVHGDTLIYGGRIRADDLLGDPDLLRRKQGGYVSGDIKSGAGVEGANDDTDGKPKKHYAVQLALYTDILERMGFSGGRTPFIWDVHGEEVIYDLDAPQGVRNPQTLWELYQSSLVAAKNIVEESEKTLPAYAGICKLCHWYTSCTTRLKELNDLTLIYELGRAKRDVMVPRIADIKHLAKADLDRLSDGKKTVFPGIGHGSLEKFQVRARIQCQPDAEPYLKEPIQLPHSERELFFDIETDPMRDICYLHGFVERNGSENSTERYVSFFAEQPTPEEEKRAFSQAWAYVQANRPCVIYYYSRYERTFWRKLQKLYPTIATEEEIEEIFAPEVSVDLYYDIVQPKTEWPTYDFSIKTIASFLGFKWRDPHPSGAASIEWYHRWVETGDPKIRQRILDYNEDDCRAMRVLLDAVQGFAVA
jgi:predicted RecB family nuclease